MRLDAIPSLENSLPSRPRCGVKGARTSSRRLRAMTMMNPNSVEAILIGGASNGVYVAIYSLVPGMKLFVPTGYRGEKQVYVFRGQYNHRGCAIFEFVTSIEDRYFDDIHARLLEQEDREYLRRGAFKMRAELMTAIYKKKKESQN